VFIDLLGIRYLLFETLKKPPQNKLNFLYKKSQGFAFDSSYLLGGAVFRSYCLQLCFVYKNSLLLGLSVLGV